MKAMIGMNAAESLANDAVEFLNARRFGEAVDKYLQALSADPRREETWLGLTLAFALAGRFGDLIGLADYRQRSRGDGFLMFYNSLLTLMTYGLHDHLLEIAKLVGPESPYAPATAYQSGCILLLRGEEGKAFTQFVTFKRLIADRADLPIGPESPFNIAYRQGTLIEDRPYIAALPEASALPLTAFIGDLHRGSGDTVLVAACDARYFDRYADRLIGSVADHASDMTLHLHIADVGSDTYRRIEALSTEYPLLALNFSTETSPACRSGAYYASMRFLIGPALIDRYRQRLVLLDVDVVIKRSLHDLIDASKAMDFACFRHDGAGPCSQYPAVLTCFAANTAGGAMLELLRRFVCSKLDIPWPYNWMLDQAALASVLRYVRTERPDIKIGILNDLAGQPYQHWLYPIADDAKEHLIRSVGAP